MEEKLQDDQAIVDLLKEHVSTRLELARLTVIQRAVIISANLITDGFVLGSVVISSLFGSVALAFYLSDVLGSYNEGFLIVTGLYFLVALIIWLVKLRYIEKPLINFMIKRILRNKRLSDSDQILL